MSSSSNDTYLRRAIGPREAGSIVRDRYNLTSRVDQVLTGAAAREYIVYASFVIIETDLDGPMAGRVRTHCTGWDPRETQVLDSPITSGSTCPLCADAGVEVVGSWYRPETQELTVWHPAGLRCVQAPVTRDGRWTSGL